jgi:hypothetical protein
MSARNSTDQKQVKPSKTTLGAVLRAMGDRMLTEPGGTLVQASVLLSRRSDDAKRKAEVRRGYWEDGVMTPHSICLMDGGRVAEQWTWSAERPL